MQTRLPTGSRFLFISWAAFLLLACAAGTEDKEAPDVPLTVAGDVEPSEQQPSDRTLPSMEALAKTPTGSRQIEGRVECAECQGQVLLIVATSNTDPPTQDTVIARRFLAEPWDFSLSDLPDDIPVYIRIRWDRSGNIESGTANPLVSAFLEFPAELGDVTDQVLSF